jgi:hypothetical protein
MTFPARKMNSLTMPQFNSFPTLMVLLTLGVGHVSFAQSEAQDKGVAEVAAFYGIHAEEVLQSATWSAEACLVGKALRVIEEPGKAVPAYQLLPGDADVSLESRILASNFRPVSGQFTWLQTAEGWYVVLPSKERFDVLFERTQISKQ